MKARTELVNTDTQMNEEPMTPAPQATPRSDTPRTDAALHGADMKRLSDSYFIRLTNLCRELERALSAAEARVKALEDALRPFTLLELTESEVAQDAKYVDGRPIFGKGALITVRHILNARAALAGKQEEGR
jgi:hypothetical protein